MRKGVIIFLMLFVGFEAVAQLNLSSSTPAANATNVSRSSNITLNFDLNVDQSTIDNGTAGDPTDDNIVISGNQTGLIAGTYSGDRTSTIILDPNNDFKSGKIITVMVTDGLQGTGEAAFENKGIVDPPGLPVRIYLIDV